MIAARNMFSLKLFGGASIEGADGPLTGRATQRRRLALLALLAASPERGVSREKLVGYLWPERDSERARHALSDSVYRLNKVLGGDAILAVGGELRLNAAVLTSDVGEFHEAIAAEEWEAAVAVYAGPFLDGFFLPDAVEFERWVDAERGRLARRYGRALESLAEERAARDDLTGAVAAWRRLAAHDRYDGRIALRLMEALAAAGNRAGAIRHARIHAQLLEEEFGTEPDAEVVALADRLRAAPAAADPMTGETEGVGEEAPHEETSHEETSHEGASQEGASPTEALPADPRSTEAPSVDTSHAATPPPETPVTRDPNAPDGAPVDPSRDPAAAGGGDAVEEPIRGRSITAGSQAGVGEPAAARPIATAPDARADEPTAARATPPVGSGSTAGADRGAPLRAVAVGLVILLLVAAGWLIWTEVESPWSRSPRASIAVLPFESLSADEEDRYFADGMTEDILTNLSGVRDLLVVSRASVMRYTGPGRSIPEIADELGVDYILEGSVRRDGDRVRITAQLVDARADAHVWADNYDRRLDDIFAVQSEIAQRVAAELDAEITSGVAERIERAPTRDLTAYNLYLRGRYFWHRRTEAGLRESARFFERAVARDSGYAQAWAGLADAYSVLAFYDYLPPGTAYPRAKRAAERALAIEPALPEAHASLGYIALYYDWDWARAEAEFRRAIELNPSYSVGHQWYANHLVAMGHFEEAAREMSRAREVNPLSLIANGALGWVYFYAGRFDDAVRQCDLALEMDPDWDLGHLWRGQAYEEMGRADDAIASLRRAVELSGRSGISLAALAHAYATSGARGPATALLAELVAADGYRPSYEIAKVHLALGRRDEAIEWLERAYEQRAHSMAFLMVDPQLEALRSDPRFVRLVESVGLRRSRALRTGA